MLLIHTKAIALHFIRLIYRRQNRSKGIRQELLQLLLAVFGTDPKQVGASLVVDQIHLRQQRHHSRYILVFRLSDLYHRLPSSYF